MVRHMGAWDLPTRPLAYKIYTQALPRWLDSCAGKVSNALGAWLCNGFNTGSLKNQWRSYENITVFAHPGHLPTAVEPLSRLAAALGGPAVRLNWTIRPGWRWVAIKPASWNCWLQKHRPMARAC